MPPSIGLTHLRPKSQQRHTYEERLAALTLTEGAERRQLASHWRNTHRVIPNAPPTNAHPDAAPSVAPSSSGSHSHGNGNAALLIVGGVGCSSSRSSLHRLMDGGFSTTKGGFPNRPQPPSNRAPLNAGDAMAMAPDGDKEGVAQAEGPQEDGGGGGVRFWSPKTTAVRGARSYVQDPHALRREANAYWAYFNSATHDAAIARDLLRRDPAVKAAAAKHKRDLQRSGLPVPEDAPSMTSTHVASSYAEVDVVSDFLGFRGHSDVSSSRRLGGGAVHSNQNTNTNTNTNNHSNSGNHRPPLDDMPSQRSLPKFPSMPLPNGTFGAASPLQSGGGGRPATVSGLGSGTGGGWSSLHPSSSHYGHGSASGSVGSGSAHPQLHVSHYEEGEPLYDGRDAGDGMTGDGMVVGQGEWGGSSYRQDPSRLRQFRNRYAPPPVSLSTLKPRCAVLHVKLEKVDRQMQHEDRAFNEFRSEYLAELKKFARY